MPPVIERKPFSGPLSGLAEPIGAIIAYAALRHFVGGENGIIPSNIMGVLFGGVAGVMVYISLDELLPTSRAYSRARQHNRACCRHGHHGTEFTSHAVIDRFFAFIRNL